MAPITTANAAKFAGSIAQFGNQMSSIIHEFITLENPFCQKLEQFLGHLSATVHTLNQVTKLLDQQTALTDDERARALLSQDGVEYIATLADECSVAICRAKFIIEGGRTRDNCVPFWDSFTTIDEKNQRTFAAPALDAIEFFKQLDDTNWYRTRLRFAIADVSERLEQLQLLLLLVIQVVTVREMTIKAPSGCGDLKSLVQYHSRVERAARLAEITNSGGSRCSSRSRRSDSDSDFSERPVRRRKPIPLAKVGPPPPPLARSFVPPPLPPPQPWSGGPLGPPVPSQPLNGVQIVDVNFNIPKDAHPPSYNEIPEKVNPTPTSIGLTSSNLSGVTVVPEKEVKKEDEKKPGNDGNVKVIETPVVTEGRLLSSPTGMGMKIKSLFRSKSSLEAEMKRTLADDNASLSAFIIQGGEFFKVPHSAFHSLEYTHMRTILSQLQDNTWFKTFSDLREPEHDALNDLGRKRMEQGKWMKRELVVLKVLQENRLNAYVRVLENCMGLNEYLPQHENGRIVLAIVRDTECKEDELSLPSRKIGTDLYEPRRIGPPIDIRVDGLASNGPGPRLGGPPPTTWNGPGRPPLPMGAGGNAPFMSCHRADITPQVPLTEATARENLTTYKAYTLRPVIPQTSPTDVGPPPQATWTRCFVTQEHDTKAVILERIAAFNRRGDSVIDLKMQLIEAQSAQISRLIDESNRLEWDRNFEYKLVELSMVDRERGLVRRQTYDIHVDVMHVVIQRSPKENVNAMLIHGPNNPPPPMRPLPRPAPPIVVVDRKRNGRRPVPYNGGRRSRSVSSYWSSSDSNTSDSDSDSTMMTGSSIGKNRRKSRKGKKGATSSDSESDHEDKSRWKRDPVTVKINKKDRKKDIVELLLDRWTPAGEGKVTVEVKVEDAKEDGKKKKKAHGSKKDKRRHKRYYSDSDFSTCDD